MKKHIRSRNYAIANIPRIYWRILLSAPTIIINKKLYNTFDEDKNIAITFFYEYRYLIGCLHVIIISIKKHNESKT
jgi:hypothetical protein